MFNNKETCYGCDYAYDVKDLEEVTDSIIGTYKVCKECGDH